MEEILESVLSINSGIDRLKAEIERLKQEAEKNEEIYQTNLWKVEQELEEARETIKALRFDKKHHPLFIEIAERAKQTGSTVEMVSIIATGHAVDRAEQAEAKLAECEKEAQAASDFIRQAVVAVGMEAPPENAYVNLEKLALQVIGEIEFWKVKAEEVEKERDEWKFHSGIEGKHQLT